MAKKFLSFVRSWRIPIKKKILKFLPLFIIQIGCSFDSPSLEFTKKKLEGLKAIETSQITEIHKKYERAGKNKAVKYTYRGVRFQKDFEIGGQKIPHNVHAEIRCYMAYMTTNPFDDQPEKDFCRYHEIKKDPLESKKSQGKAKTVQGEEADKKSSDEQKNPVPAVPSDAANKPKEDKKSAEPPAKEKTKN